MHLTRRVLVLLTSLVALALACASQSEAAGWTAVPMPSAGGTPTLNSVSCFSVSNCTAVGFDQQFQQSGPALIAVKHGSTWSYVTGPTVPGYSGVDLRGVSCPTADTCVAIGQATTAGFPGVEDISEISSGATWSVVPIADPTGVNLLGVSCTSATACTAVGQSLASRMPIAERWNGTSWTLQTLPPGPAGTGSSSPSSGSLHAVLCISRWHCVAVGNTQPDPSSQAQQALIEVWNGFKWRIERTPSTASGLTGVSCTSRWACTAVGSSDVSVVNASPVALRLRVFRWVPQSTPQATVNGQPVSSGWQGVSCSTWRNCQAVGAAWGANFASYGEVAAGWNGRDWLSEPTPGAGTSLTSVSCPTPTQCIATGNQRGTGGPLVESYQG